MVNENFISTLQQICFYEGEVVKEEGLLKGHFNGETAHLCDPSSYMDVELQHFPQVLVTITKDETNKWFITGGVIGVAEDSLSPFDNEAVAAYVLGLLGYDVPVAVRMVENQDREPGAAPDGSYFIPNIDATQGLLIVLNTHRLAVLWRLENDSEKQIVIGQNELDDTNEMFGMYFGENIGLELDDAVLTVGQLKVTDNGTPYRVDTYWLPSLQIEVGIELMHCLNWEARISYVTDVSNIMNLPADNPFMDIKNKELCDRGSVLRVRKHPLMEGVFVIGLLRDRLVEGGVELSLSPKLKEFISLVYAAENLAVEFSSDFSRYWVTGYLQTGS
jgi:hypothetical protein